METEKVKPADEMNVRERIFLIMEWKGISQRSLAAQLGISEQSVSDWKREGEKASRSYMKYLPQIAAVLGTTVDALTSGKENSATTDEIESNLRFALYGELAPDVTAAQLEDVKRYASYIRERERGKEQK